MTASKRVTHVRWKDGQTLAIPDPDLVSRLDEMAAALEEAGREPVTVVQARQVIDSFWGLVQANKRERADMVDGIRQGLAANAKLPKEKA